jgi:hypothetical protein
MRLISIIFTIVIITQFVSCINVSSTSRFKKPKKLLKKDSKPISGKQNSSTKKTDDKPESDQKKDDEKKESNKKCGKIVNEICTLTYDGSDYIISSTGYGIQNEDLVCTDLYLVKSKEEKIKIDNAKFKILKKTEIFREKKDVTNSEGIPQTQIINTYNIQFDITAKLINDKEDDYRVNSTCRIYSIL